MNEPRGVRVWLPATAGIGLWMVHLTALSSLSRWACRFDTNWVAHTITAITAGLTALAMAECEHLRRRGAHAVEVAEEPVELAHNLVFIGLFGLCLGGFSLLLILYEGSWALTVPPCHP